MATSRKRVAPTGSSDRAVHATETLTGTGKTIGRCEELRFINKCMDTCFRWDKPNFVRLVASPAAAVGSVPIFRSTITFDE
jgi:hypothetical protein